MTTSSSLHDLFSSLPRQSLAGGERERSTAVHVLLLHLLTYKETSMGRGLLLWLLGVPIPVILLLWLFFGT
ncbi:hypothetical protein J2S34_000804 [Nitrobacter winogradskyi]|uniref:Uncharacterized protein n=1 Tax=Nitrobacter winogradskyi TaxID=913 RepID=A0ACC6AFT4_NITWI|nr:hypothetical protein [Nitrobacter winogradskyi]